MLSIQEEKSFYFPNHNWKEFRTMYERRIESYTKVYKAMQIMEKPQVDNLVPIYQDLQVFKKRLSAIDQVIAHKCDVVFELVSSGLPINIVHKK